MGRGGVAEGGAGEALGLRLSAFNWVDDCLFPILGELPEAAARIEEGVARGGVLVHCFQGASRSAAAVCAWLLWRHPERAPSVEAAHAWLRGCRPLVGMNAGFCAQLEAFRGAAVEAAAAEGGGRWRAWRGCGAR